MNSYPKKQLRSLYWNPRLTSPFRFQRFGSYESDLWAHWFTGTARVPLPFDGLYFEAAQIL